MVKKRRNPPGADEAAFLERYDPADFEHPSVTVDVALLTMAETGLQVLLTQRQEHPGRGKWALPGGFVGMEEALDRAAARVLHSKAGRKNVFLEQLYTFGAPKRDPRTRVITVAYYALVDHGRLGKPQGQGETTTLGEIHTPWQGEAGGPVEVRDENGEALPLAFDHAEIIGMAVKRLRGKLNYSPVGFQLLPADFTLRRLQDVHEAILGRRLNKDSFRRRMLASGLLAPTGEREGEVGHRPAELYQFTAKSAI